MTSSTQAQALAKYENETKKRDVLRQKREEAYIQIEALEDQIALLKRTILQIRVAEAKMEPELRELARIATYGE